MAVHTREIEFAFESNDSSLAATTRFDFASKTLDIAETSGRVFRSVTLVVTARDDAAAAQSPTAWLLGIKLGAIAFDDATVTDTLTNSGEHQTYRFQRDVTSYFATNFGSGASQTCQVGVKLTAGVAINITAKLYITYEANDATTRTKTVRIPLDSPTTLLTASLATAGGSNGIPKLTGSGGLLPEASVSIKDLWFELSANEASAAATDFQLGMDVDGGTEHLDGNHQQALNSSCLFEYIWSQPSLDPTTAHTLHLRSTVASRFANVAIVMCVTYTYNHSTSTRVLNSLVMPFQFQWNGPSSAADPMHWIHEFPVSEPGSISLKQSGVRLDWWQSQTQTMNVKVGAQSVRAYTVTKGSADAGAHVLTHRFDSGGAQGSGLALAAGWNSLDVEFYGSNAFGVSGVVYLNYESDIASEGDGAHFHSTHWGIADTAADDGLRGLGSTGGFVQKTTPIIPETSYLISHVGFRLPLMGQGTYAVLVCWGDDVNSGSTGMRRVFGDVVSTDNETGLFFANADMTRHVKKFVDDPDELALDIEVTRAWRLYTLNSTWKAASLWLTASGYARTVAGTVTGYTGNGSGIPVQVFNPELVLVAETTTAIGGTYSCNAYDGRDGHFAVALQGTAGGRSDDFAPTTTTADIFIRDPSIVDDAPTITLVSPADLSAILADEPVVISVADVSPGGIQKAFGWFKYASDRHKTVIYDGGAFSFPFDDDNSTVEDVNNDGTEYLFTIHPLGGWRDVIEMLRFRTVDTGGNLDEEA